MYKIHVHPRVHRRHPELCDEDVVSAWNGALVSTSRPGKNPDEYVALGFDRRGRLLEIVAARDGNGNWMIFHATTPPSDKTFKELGIAR